LPLPLTALISFVRVTEHALYELLKSEGIPDVIPDLPELSGYELPNPETWIRQARTARSVLGEQKYTRRAGHAHGSGIGGNDSIKHPGRSDE
jgi:hypothetical protein